uniref:Uncharacterized protein n=1 Tax=Arundo donax TaxID=35708 RepID=A0A0A8ZKL9_ARUDO
MPDLCMSHRQRCASLVIYMSRSTRHRRPPLLKFIGPSATYIDQVNTSLLFFPASAQRRRERSDRFCAHMVESILCAYAPIIHGDGILIRHFASSWYENCFFLVDKLHWICTRPLER